MNTNIGEGEPQESILIIHFSEPGSVFFDVRSSGIVFPGQMVLAGEYLREKGLELIRLAEHMQREQEEKKKIATPKLIVPK